MRPTPFLDRFSADRPLVGVVHLPALPGSPAAEASMGEVRERAVRDARVLAEGGMDGVLVENYGDAPYPSEEAGAPTVASMAVIAAAVRAAVGVPVGVNVLRNGAEAALAAAAAAEADFVRVNVWTGARLTDQGLIQGAAHRVLRMRRCLEADVAVLADVAVKHSAPLTERPLAEEAAEAVGRGRADGLLVTGSATGLAPDPGRLEAVRRAAEGRPVLAASGVTPENAHRLVVGADGAVVGTALKEGGETSAPVEMARVQALVEAARGTPTEGLS